MQKELVSLLTPMYNTEKYVHRLLDSVLRQTYPSIEMIVIDDGSTDNSRDVVSQYMDSFKSKGYILKYAYQENSGQSLAIKNGLQMISGEYLAWPDSDDFYATDDAIARMVDVLSHSTEEFQMVRTQETLVEDGTLKPIGLFGKDANEEEPQSLFYDCLYAENGFFFCPGAYLVRTSTLYKLTSFNIYTDKNAGQNWQLMLPILYKYRCKTIKEPLYNVVVRQSSHSRGQYQGYDALETKFASYYATQVETLNRIEGMPDEEVKNHERRLKEKYARQLFKMAITANRLDRLKFQYNILKDIESVNNKDRVLAFISVTLRMPIVAKLLMKISNKLYILTH